MTGRSRVFRGDRLRVLRESRNISQDDLEKRLKLSDVQIYKYESGRSEPSPEIIARIAREFEVTTDYLLGLVDEPTERLQSQDVNDEERELLQALRRGDLREFMRVAVKLATVT